MTVGKGGAGCCDGGEGGAGGCDDRSSTMRVMAIAMRATAMRASAASAESVIAAWRCLCKKDSSTTHHPLSHATVKTP